MWVSTSPWLSVESQLLSRGKKKDHNLAFKEIDWEERRGIHLAVLFHGPNASFRRRNWFLKADGSLVLHFIVLIL